MTELAEGARLEIVLGANNSHVGSNPTLSAIFLFTILPIQNIKNKDEIPEEFETIEQIQDFWDTHSTADYWDEMEDMEMELSPAFFRS